MANLNQLESEQLFRPTGTLISFSDTFSTPTDVAKRNSNGEVPSELTETHTDFDSQLTHQFRHLRPRDNEYGIGDQTDNYLFAAYGIELVAQLVDGLKAEIAKATRRATELSRPIHPTILEAQEFISSRAIRVIANGAPRFDSNENENGSNFYLAILNNGVEIYATPLDALQFVRDKVVTLLEIPNKDNPIFDGRREQFRSSLIARLCEEPEHLIRKNTFSIPDQDHPIQHAYDDRFGNIRLRAKSKSLAYEAIRKIRNGSNTVGIKFSTFSDPAHTAVLYDCLDEVPSGKLGLYGNVADGKTEGDKAVYLELAYKWDDGNKINTHHRLGRPPIGSAVEIVPEEKAGNCLITE